MKLLALLMLIFSVSEWAHAQSAGISSDPAPSAESASLPSVAASATEEKNSFEDYVTTAEITPYLQIANFSFYAGAPDIHGKAYVPNFSTSAGLALGWREYSLATGISLPIPKEELDRRGHSDQFNAILSKYWRQSAVNIYYQKYRGFYAGSPGAEFNLSKPERFTQFPEAHAINYGANYYFAFDGDEYSFSAAFANKERQTRSGGSWLGHAFYNHVELSLGTKIIPGSDPDDVQAMPELQDVALETGGLGGGYGYTLIFDRYAATAQAILGAGLQSKTGTASSDMFHSVYTWAVKGNVNLSLSYQLQQGLVGLRFLMDTLYSNVDDTQIYSTFMVGTLFYQHRF